MVLCCTTLSSSREKPNASLRGSKKNFWRRCRGDQRQVKTYQVPIINSHPSHYIICHSPLVFLSLTSKTILKNICLFFAPLPFVFFVWFLCACLAAMASTPIPVSTPDNEGPNFKQIKGKERT